MSQEGDITPAELAEDLLADKRRYIMDEFALEKFEANIIKADPSDSQRYPGMQVLLIECESLVENAVNQAFSHCESVLSKYNPIHLRSAIVYGVVDECPGWAGSEELAIPRNGGGIDKEQET